MKMKLRDWIIVFLLVVCSNLITLVIAREFFIPSFKTVDITKVVEDDEKLRKLAMSKKLTKEEYQQYYNQKIGMIGDAVNAFTNENDIVLIKGAIIKTNTTPLQDITKEVNTYVEKHTIYIKK